MSFQHVTLHERAMTTAKEYLKREAELIGMIHQALENKIFFLLSKLGSKNTTKLKGGTLWARFQAFKEVRDGLVHPRQHEQQDLHPEDVRNHVETAKDLIQEISQRIWKKKLDL